MSNYSETEYGCVKCNAPIDVGPDPWQAHMKTFVCPQCGAKNYFYSDESGDGDYWFAFELTEE